MLEMRMLKYEEVNLLNIFQLESGEVDTQKHVYHIALRSLVFFMILLPQATYPAD